MCFDVKQLFIREGCKKNIDFSFMTHLHLLWMVIFRIIYKILYGPGTILVQPLAFLKISIKKYWGHNNITTWCCPTKVIKRVSPFCRVELAASNADFWQMRVSKIGNLAPFYWYKFIPRAVTTPFFPSVRQYQLSKLNNIFWLHYVPVIHLADMAVWPDRFSTVELPVIDIILNPALNW